ncbi:PREDICTED: uncharacterized protein LOC100641865, partial [Amphimedon queenslandica]|uniref:GST N-terminal domain-containing protein n=1 Tax=Amphimedon queenslandica TaxID=400682 RepID=A0AAN0JXZ7_AMPQE
TIDTTDILKWANEKGEFIRKPSSFRNWITADGSSGFKAEAGRYHLYVSLACPWAHRTLIVRQLKGLEDVITFNVVDYHMGPNGWRFNPAVEGATPDTVNGFSMIREVYFKVDPDYSGRFTIPVLYDKVNGTIVDNESSEIIRMLNTEFNCIYSCYTILTQGINNGVYRAGFATAQDAYDKAVREVFESLDCVEGILSTQRYLTGASITEADVRLYTTLVRFDPVYVGHFKCNKKRIVDYPNIWGYLRDLYNTPGFGSTTNRYHIEHHYQKTSVKQKRTCY